MINIGKIVDLLMLIVFGLLPSFEKMGAECETVRHQIAAIGFIDLSSLISPMGCCQQLLIEIRCNKSILLKCEEFNQSLTLHKTKQI